jgi:hypothetical protein
MEFLNNKWLNTNKDLTYGKILMCTNKHQVKYLGSYLGKFKCKWVIKTKGK